jgi:uncharacterized membrane protein YgdD (TMEM256/DUF423 family)
MRGCAVTTKWIALGGAFAFLAVLLGAFGAHGLENRLTPHLLDVYKTGAYYQMVHALGLILIGQRVQRRPESRMLAISCGLLTAGIVVFSGSLYILALSGQAMWGAVTPLGGLCFMAGWACFVAAELSSNRANDP